MVAEMPQDDRQAQKQKVKLAEQSANRLGLVVSELTPEQRKEFAFPAVC